jgi:hypothetical protein
MTPRQRRLDVGHAEIGRHVAGIGIVPSPIDRVVLRS